MRVVVWDFGGPVLKTLFELVPGTKKRLGLPDEALADWTGPYDEAKDELWQQFQAGEMTEQDYWAERARQFAPLAGVAPDFQSLMGEFFHGTEAELVRDDSKALIREMKDAGIPVGLLTNDLTTFHDAEWIESMTVLAEFDHVVDGGVDKVKKPQPEAYRLICERMGVEPGDVIFIDDQPINIQGAKDVGMITVHFDPTDPQKSYAEIRDLLGLVAVG